MERLYWGKATGRGSVSCLLLEPFPTAASCQRLSPLQGKILAVGKDFYSQEAEPPCQSLSLPYVATYHSVDAACLPYMTPPVVYSVDIPLVTTIVSNRYIFFIVYTRLAAEVYVVLFFLRYNLCHTPGNRWFGPWLKVCPLCWEWEQLSSSSQGHCLFFFSSPKWFISLPPHSSLLLFSILPALKLCKYFIANLKSHTTSLASDFLIYLKISPS